MTIKARKLKILKFLGIQPIYTWKFKSWCETKMDLDVGKNKMSLGSSIFDHFKLTSSWVINPFEVNHCATNPIIDLPDQITGHST